MSVFFSFAFCTNVCHDTASSSYELLCYLTTPSAMFAKSKLPGWENNTQPSSSATVCLMVSALIYLLLVFHFKVQHFSFSLQELKKRGEFSVTCQDLGTQYEMQLKISGDYGKETCPQMASTYH